jgi:hypothetical protein
LIKNIRSLPGVLTVYNEPDWSSLTLLERLDKAREFSEKAYATTMSTYAFLERALEASPKHTDMSEEIAELAGRAQLAHTMLADLQRDIATLINEFPKTNDGGFFSYSKP